jgi:multimeric flavodoxin WrbA
MITILADDSLGQIGLALYETLRGQAVQAEYIDLADVAVKPCVNCGSCNNKTYGRCAVRDDADILLPRMAAAEALVVVTPVLFGGYSVRVKRLLDKLGLIMDRHYYLHRGELAKGGLPGRRFHYRVLGVQQTPDAAEAEAFCALVGETVRITRGRGGADTGGPTAEGWPLRRIAEEVTRA